MTHKPWLFCYYEIATGETYTESHVDWQAARDALIGFIEAMHSARCVRHGESEAVHPVRSFQSLKDACENFPRDLPASITDGEHCFGVKIET